MAAIIQPSNAVYASIYLLNLDIQAIETKYQRAAASIAEQLKSAQRTYMGTVYKKNLGERLDVNAEEPLATLTETANHLAGFLSKESQERLLTDLHVRKELRTLNEEIT
ncbi:MAG: hypothetical protein ACNA7Y_00160 [Gammaproteobacteria bacterium]